MIRERQLLTARAVFEIAPAASDGEDVTLFSDEKRSAIRSVFRFLRNQEPKEKDVPNLSLADYIAPKSDELKDYMGLFVVTASLNDEAMSDYREDDYALIMIRILSDRIAEAAAEWLHERIRREYWGYAESENLNVDEVLKQKYSGIRPAPGYPACPDHTEKRTIFDLLEAEKNIAAELTDNFAMVPPASVCGYLFSHPQSVYFNVGKLGSDQLSDYAGRKNITFEEAARWLAPNL